MHATALYISRHTSLHLLAPVISTSTNSVGPSFVRRVPVSRPFRHSASAMATCVSSPATQTPPQTDDRALDSYKKCRNPNFPREVNSNTRRANAQTPDEGKIDDLWLRMQDEARSDVDQEPVLCNYYFTSILSHHSMETALANYLSVKLSNSSLASSFLYQIILGVLEDDEEIMRAVASDLTAVKERDPACISYVHCFLNFKGFLAIQSHRIAHSLWSKGRNILALVIQNRVSEVFAVDIHPGAKIGGGILLDHATGVVIGETAVIGNNVSILHNVTLGGTGKASGDRHPKIGDGVLIGAGTCVLGSVRIEDGAKIGAGSVVLKGVPARTTAVGNPARLLGGKENPVRHDRMASLTMDQTSHITDWSDYVI